MLYFILGKEESFSKNELISWGDYFNSFQKEDGLFVDPVLVNENFYNLDWWGARHLPLQIIICLNYIGIKPRYEFNFIKKYYNENELIAY
jgi:hypothetical protein